MIAWFVVTDPAVAVKLPVVEPAATVTEAGTVRAALLPETVTGVLAVAAADKVTVQGDVVPEAIVAGEHCSPERTGGVGVALSGMSVTLSRVLNVEFSLHDGTEKQ